MRVGVLGFLGRRPEVNRALMAHANVAGDGGSACPGEDGAASLGRSLATGKHGLPFFFAFSLGGSTPVASAPSGATKSSSWRRGGGGLRRRRVHSVSVVEAEEQEKL
jgi:hypothetical protein